MNETVSQFGGLKMLKEKIVSVLYVCTVELSRNGIVNWLLNYSSSIKELYPTYEITIGVPKILDEKLLLKFNDLNINVIELNNRNKNPLKYIFQLANLVKINKFDIVHIHGNSSMMLIDLLGAKLGGCHVNLVHSHSTNTNYPTLNKILKPIFLHSYTCAFACGYSSGKWLYGKNNFYIIKNGISFIKFKKNSLKRRKMREQFSIEDDIVLGHVGYFDENKNQIFLIRLLNELNKISPKYSLVLIGDGKNKDYVFQEVQKYNLENKVKFLGVVSSPSEYMQTFDIFVLPSFFEGLPYVLIEAQAMNIPCIVSKDVSEEACLTEKYFSLPLEINQWINTIISLVKENRVDENVPNKELFDFDISLNTKKLVEQYDKILLNTLSGKHG